MYLNWCYTSICLVLGTFFVQPNIVGLSEYLQWFSNHLFSHFVQSIYFRLKCWGGTLSLQHEQKNKCFEHHHQVWKLCSTLIKRVLPFPPIHIKFLRKFFEHGGPNSENRTCRNQYSEACLLPPPCLTSDSEEVDLIPLLFTMSWSSTSHVPSIFAYQEILDLSGQRFSN